MPKISVIVPVYNVEKYLKKCLDSIIEQTLQDIEIICVNDGSTDGSSQILDNYAQQDIRIKVIHKKNTGYGNSMNRGIDMAIGEFIGIVESDDFAAANMFEDLYNIAHDNDAEVVKSNFYEVSSEGTEFLEALKKCDYNEAFCPIHNREVFYAPPSIWAGIYKREYLKKNKIEFTETPGASYQDTSFIFKVWACAQKVIMTEKAYIHYRIDNSNSSVNSSSKIYCVCDEYESSEKYINDYLPENREMLIMLLTGLKYQTYMWNYERLAAEFQYSFLQIMVNEFLDAKNKGTLKPEYFNKSAWNEVNRIIDAPDYFFKNTAKIYRDKGLTNKPALNYIIYENGFLELMKQYQNIIIYGAGVVGQYVLQYLERHEVNHIVCLAVTSALDNPEKIDGVPIRSISDLTDYAEKGLIIVATLERIQDEIIDTLKSLQYHNVVAIDNYLLEAIKNN